MTTTTDDIQVVTPDPEVSDVEFIEITDPVHLNGWFGQGVEKDDLIELRQDIPESYLAAARTGQHPPDELLNAIPGKAIVRPDHPALELFRKLHANHATFKDFKVLPDKTVEESVQGKRKRR